MIRDTDLEALLVAKFVVMAPVLDERGRRLWAAAESAALGYGGDSVVSAATGLSRTTVRAGRLELAAGVTTGGRIRRPGAGRPDIEQTQPGVTEALNRCRDPMPEPKLLLDATTAHIVRRRAKAPRIPTRTSDINRPAGGAKRPPVVEDPSRRFRGVYAFDAVASII